MKRTLLIAIILVLGIEYARGQNSETDKISGTVNVSATVQPSIEIITVNSVKFGETPPENGQIYINPVNDLNAGFMIAIGSPEAEFRLNYLPERQLNRINGTGTLIFTYEISGSTEDEQASSELLDLENRNIRFNDEGRYYIWVGGLIDLSNAAPGRYEGDFTIEIDYI